MGDIEEPMLEDDPPVSNLALVARGTQLGAHVRIGPFTLIGREGDEPVEIGEGTVIGTHVLVEPGAKIGIDCVIANYSRIGRGSVIAPRSEIHMGGPMAKRPAWPHSPTLQTDEDADRPISGYALVASNVELGEEVEIGPFAIVGWEGEEPVRLGARTSVSPFALIEPGATIGADCRIDAFCRITDGAVIGDGTQILYGAAVFDKARVGAKCIIGSDVADRTIIEDCVTFFGEIAHAYRDPGDIKAWDEKEDKSPTIKACSIVGQSAIIIGGRTIGPKSYIAAGEVVRTHVPPEMFVQKGQMKELSAMRGFVRVRSDGACP